VIARVRCARIVISTRDALLDRFTGGLLVTCGLLTIGSPPGRALHGDISHRPATAVRAKPSRGRARMSLAAYILSESDFGQALQLQRRICSGFDDAGAAFLSVRDRDVNTGVAPAPDRSGLPPRSCPKRLRNDTDQSDFAKRSGSADRVVIPGGKARPCRRAGERRRVVATSFPCDLGALSDSRRLVAAQSLVRQAVADAPSTTDASSRSRGRAREVRRSSRVSGDTARLSFHKDRPAIAPRAPFATAVSTC
jgi:hypothetical protein